MNLDVGGDAGPADFPVNTWAERRFVYRGATPEAGQFKGRYRVGGEVALFDAEGRSNISGADHCTQNVDWNSGCPRTHSSRDGRLTGTAVRRQLDARSTSTLERAAKHWVPTRNLTLPYMYAGLSRRISREGGRPRQRA